MALTVHSVFAHVEKLLHFRPGNLLKPPLLTNNGESTVRPRRGEGNVARSPEPAVVATQGSTAALLPPRGGHYRPGTPRSDVLRNETAIQRVLQMAAHAHEFECESGGVERSRTAV